MNHQLSSGRLHPGPKIQLESKNDVRPGNSQHPGHSGHLGGSVIVCISGELLLITETRAVNLT